MISIGGPLVLGRNFRAISLPAFQVPASKTLTKGRPLSVIFSLDRTRSPTMSSRATVSARHSTITWSCTWKRGTSSSLGICDSFNCNTPKSTNNPPLRYSASPVRTSVPENRIPNRLSGSCKQWDNASIPSRSMWAIAKACGKRRVWSHQTDSSASLQKCQIALGTRTGRDLFHGFAGPDITDAYAKQLCPGIWPNFRESLNDDLPQGRYRNSVLLPR